MRFGKKPHLIYRDGKLVAVMLDLRQYEAMLERLEDAEDLEMLRAMRSRPLRFQTLEQFLEDHAQTV
jgi:PHD/YefM family antitoxin component YafN of YafNO toxin-antitoxin module